VLRRRRPLLPARLRSAASRLDREVAERRKRLAPGELLCRNGCFGCCIGLFALPLSEALAVRSAWRRLPPRVRADALDRARRALEKGGSLFPGDPWEGLLDPERTDRSDERYFDEVESVPCPLLDLPSGRCLVYAVRPVTCRTFGFGLRDGASLVEPACRLNFGDAPPDGELPAAFDLRDLLEIDQAIAEAADADGLPAGVETTLAHVLAGRAFARL